MSTIIGLMIFFALLRFGVYEIIKASTQDPRFKHLVGTVAVMIIAYIAISAAAAPYMDTETIDVAGPLALLTLFCSAVAGWIATKQ